MKKSVFRCVNTVLALSLLGLVGCYAKVEVSDSSDEKAIAIDWVEPPCAEPGSAAGYIEGNGFGATNVTITIGGIEAEVLAATGKDASFVVPEGLAPGPVEVVVENPGGRLATINWVVCGFDCSAIDCDDGNECTTDTCDSVVEECVHTPVGDGAACDFGGLPGICAAGICEEDLCANVDCEDGDPCTTDTCDPLNGTCSHVNTCGDTDPPVLTDFDFNPKSVDVTSGPASVTCDVTLTDSPAGVTSVGCIFQSPSGSQQQNCNTMAPSSGDIFNGVWSCTSTIPQDAEAGAWRVSKLDTYDTVGNRRQHDTADLQALGFPTQLDVTSSGGDSDPPVLTDFDFNPKSVDVTSGPASVTCDVTLTDSPAGVTSVGCIFQSPSGSQQQNCNTMAPSSGDIFNGVWSCTSTIPQDAEAGAWRVSKLDTYDTVGNRRQHDTADLQALGFPTQLDVTSSGGDSDPPVLTDFDFNPKSVDVTSGPASVTCDVTLTDSPAGVTSVGCIFQSPSGSQQQNCNTMAPSSGDIFNGVWSCTSTIPQDAEAGAWRVSKLDTYDTVGNRRQYTTADLQTLGFPTQLDVTYGAGPDLDPPMLTGFDFNPKVVDNTNGSGEVTFTFEAADAGVGVNSMQVRMGALVGNGLVGCNTSAPISGDRNNGTWTCTYNLDEFAAAGTYRIEYLLMGDLSANSVNYDALDLESLGFPTELEVTSPQADLDPPMLTGFDFNPKVVDNTNGSGEVTFTFEAADAGVGVNSMQVRMGALVGNGLVGCNTSAPISGDRNNGTWTCTYNLDEFAAAGTYRIEYLLMGDLSANSVNYDALDLESLGFPTELEVTSPQADLDPPMLTGFDFNPKVVDNTNGSGEVTFTFEAADAGVGVNSMQVRMGALVGNGLVGCNTSAPISGDRNNGTWTCTYNLDEFAAAGTYRIEYLLMGDLSANSVNYDALDLVSLGFPTELEVTYSGGSPSP